MQLITRDGLPAVYSNGDAANGHEFDNSRQGPFLHVKNGGASPIDVTIVTSRKIDGLEIANRVVSVANGTEQFIGPFQNDTYGSGTNSTDVWVDLSADTSVTLAVLNQSQA